MTKGHKSGFSAKHDALNEEILFGALFCANLVVKFEMVSF